nr:hypothetical protein GCM10020093_102390 [Planobispora longispora]
MAAQREEAVVPADRTGLQQRLEQAGHQLLHRAARGHPLGVRGVGRVGQPGPVDLAVRGQRQRGQLDQVRRDQVGGQALGQVGGQLPGVADDVGHQLGLVLPAHDHHAVGDGGMGGQDGLHLPGFDPVPADLDLAVRAAEELDGSVRQPPCPVAGAVEARARPAEGMGDEDGRSLPRRPR